MPDKTAAEAIEPQSIEDLQERYQLLNTRKIQAETNLANAKKQLEQLQQEAREKYQTDDLAALREKLDTTKAENEEKRRDYQQQLDRIDREIVAVEKRFASPEQLAGNEEAIA
jgi:chromosome segregation ATPase